MNTGSSLNIKEDIKYTTELLYPYVFEEYKKNNTKEFINITLELRNPSHFESKLGGIPYLDKLSSVPESEEGTPLRFFAQFNLSEFPDHNLPFPKEGILQFWLLADDLMGLDTEGGSFIKYYKVIDETITEEEILKKV